MIARSRGAAGVPALLLVVVLLSLATLAYASPPDQTWIGGLYDDADYDDVVLLIGSIAVAFTHAAPPPAPRFVVVAVVALPAAAPVPCAPRLASPSRAPPSARSR